MKWRPFGLAITAVLVSAATILFLYQKSFRPSPLTAEILVLGDSQLSFGAGPAFSEFFGNLPQQCSGDIDDPADLNLLSGKRFAMIGTRSTSLQSWVTTSGRAWELLCHKDKKWGVNASAWGTVKPPRKKYVQVGEGEFFQFCRRPETPLQNLFATGYYSPQLLMLFVGGNGAGRLARDPAAANDDVSRLIADLPDKIGCVFMMTAPIYSRSHNNTRLFTQANLRAAFARHGNRCAFVDGHTPKTRAAIQGQPQFFRRDDKGKVKDKYHANKEAAARFLSLRRGALCLALVEQMRKRRINTGG